MGEYAFYADLGLAGSIQDKRYNFYRGTKDRSKSVNDYEREFFLDLLGLPYSTALSTRDAEYLYFLQQGADSVNEGFQLAWAGLIPLTGISVFNSTYNSRVLTVGTDGTPSIRIGTSFYFTGLETFECIGERVWIPANAPVGATMDMFLYTPGALNPDLGAVAARTESVTITGTERYLDCTWDTPFTMTVAVPVFVGYVITGAHAGKYFATAASPTPGPVQAADGSTLFESSTTEATWARSIFKIGAGANTPNNVNVYGVDIRTRKI